MNSVPDHIAQTGLAGTRLAMRHGAIAMTDERLRRQLSELFPDAAPEDVENLMRSLRKFGKSLAPVVKQVLPVLQRAAPGAIQGALTGAAAGPYGALAGAGIGAVTSLLASPSQPQQPAPRPVPRPAPPPTARPAVAPLAAPRAPTSAPAAPAPTAGRGPAGGTASQTAVLQLLALLARPETMQALSALLMGRQGRREVRVGQRQVPVAAFANAIAEYAGEAAALAEPTRHAEQDAETLRESGVDVANPRARADLLLQALLAQPDSP